MTTDRPVPRQCSSGSAIAGGRVDADRLGRQADVMAAATAALLTRVGLRPGWACLDVGCGTGRVTGEMARTAGSSAPAVGVDRDAEALRIARGAAAAAGLRAPRTGRAFAVRQHHVLRLRDGLLAEHIAVRDDLGMMAQPGHLPPTPGALLRMVGPDAPRLCPPVVTNHQRGETNRLGVGDGADGD